MRPTPYPIADTRLARRIEEWTARDVAAFAASCRASGIYPDAVAQRVGGGTLVWIGPGSPVNGSFGLGMAERPVDLTEVDALVEFFRQRGEAPSTDVCPHAHPSLLDVLAAAGFVATGFESVLYQPLAGTQPAPRGGQVSVVIARTAEERAVWADCEARGFTDDKASSADHALARALALRDDAIHFLGLVDGEPAGTGMLVIADGIAAFNGDATLPAFRGRGVQSAILAERLRYAQREGADLAVIEAAPGSTSQRNQERAGFRVAYTRASLRLGK
jgi:GNAT superfamily N-acetyltransferase